MLGVDLHWMYYSEINGSCLVGTKMHMQCGSAGQNSAISRSYAYIARLPSNSLGLLNECGGAVKNVNIH